MTKTRTISNLDTFIQSGAGAAPRTIDSRLKDTVSVKDFGAKGDGASDDRDAIVTALSASVGKVLYFPPGIYVIGSGFTIPSNSTLIGEYDKSVIRFKDQVWPSSDGIIGTVLTTNIEIDSLVFDRAATSTIENRVPALVVFRSNTLRFRRCVFRNIRGICMNLSTDVDDIVIDGCRFLECGGSPGDSTGRRQAIAFSSTPNERRTRNVMIKNCYFFKQALDCISIADCDNVAITDNLTDESYSFAYSNPLPYYTTNVLIANNVIRNTSEFGALTDVPPAPIDMPSARGLTVIGNTIYDCDSTAIGIFSNSRDVLVSGNNIINPMRASIAFSAGIYVSSSAQNVKVCDNLIVDLETIPKMLYGIVFGSGVTNLQISNNLIKNPSLSRFGYSTTGPFPQFTFSYNETSPVSSSISIIDHDSELNKLVSYARNEIKVSTTSAALQITQAGTGDVLNAGDLLRVKKSGAARLTPRIQPVSAEAGDIYYDQATNKLRCFNGTSWNDLF